MVELWTKWTNSAIRVCKPSRLPKPGFSGLESSKPGFGFANDVTALTAVKPITSPDHRPACSPLPNCFSFARASSVACITPTIRNWTPKCDWKHHQLIASCKQKQTESQPSQYHIHIVINHHWSLIWRNYNSLSLILHEKPEFFKISSKKSSIN